MGNKFSKIKFSNKKMGVMTVLSAFLLICLCYNVASGLKEKNTLSIKRILSELREINNQEISMDFPFNNTMQECGVRLSPMKDNLLEWHFSFTGVEGTNYDKGIYHGRILLNSEYPRKAPSISISTPSGRWEVNKDICLSASAHHQETWNPNWNLRTLVMSLRGFMTTQPHEIGSMVSTPAYQVNLAKRSQLYCCPRCNTNHLNLLANEDLEDLLKIDASSHIRKFNHNLLTRNIEKSKKLNKSNKKRNKKPMFYTSKKMNLVSKTFFYVASFLLILLVQCWGIFFNGQYWERVKDTVKLF